MGFDLKARIDELAPGKTVADLARDAHRRGISFSEKAIYQAITRNARGEGTPPSLSITSQLAAVLGISVDEFLGRRPVEPQPEDYARDEEERQLLFFFRNMAEDRKLDLVLFANHWYSVAHPEDRRANPFAPRRKK